ncbi:MAG: class F sortase [Candidatus Roizmanbacteria bacterium]|nr:MAG: class F sortase [Candidatus Roizmanbacteria bacterium]
MKKLVLILVAAVGILAGVIFQNQAEFTITAPVSIEIPKINVIAAVEPVGLDAAGNMDVPKNVYNVAWYQLGPPPGAKGSAVVAGHYDSLTGPAIFFNLSNLEPGDEITVVDENNVRRLFTVEKKEVYADADFPINEVFAKVDKARLNLVSCRGKFDKVKREYPERVVVYTVLGRCTSKLFNYCIRV